MYLVDVLRPKSFVELGSYYGVSYCAFCQAVKELGLDTRCYAVDTWQGDPHTSFYGPEVFADLEKHNDARYSSFSRLIQSTFDEALKFFRDDTFDLLHIDGYHTYEAVKSDFEKWLPKMTDRGVFLLHDINVRERDFGVWKLWDELKLRYPSFEFGHSHGLGVLAVGKNYPEDLNALLQCSETEAKAVRRFFSNLGSRLEVLSEAQDLKLELETLRAKIPAMSAQIDWFRERSSVVDEQLLDRDAQIQAKDLELTALQAQLFYVSKQYGELQGRRNEQHVIIGDREAQLNSAFSQLEESRQQLEESRQQLDENREQLEESRQQLEESRQILQTQGEEITALKQDSNHREGKAEENQSELQARAQEIATLSQDLRKRSIEFEKTRRELQVQAQQITALKKELKDKDDKLEFARQGILSWEQRTQELANLLAGMEDIRRTGSYRLVRALSSPLRLGKKYRKSLARFSHRLNGRVIDFKSGLKTEAVRPGHAGELSLNTESVDTDHAHVADSRLSDKESLLAENSWLISTPSTKETALFDPVWYLSKNPDVAASNVDPLVHFLREGAKEGRSPHPLFDPKYYLTTYPEAAIGGGANALKHYLTQGWKKGFKPNSTFDPSFYLGQYPEIAQAGIEPLTHFVTIGLREGRSGCGPKAGLAQHLQENLEISRNPMPVAVPPMSDVKAIAFYLPQFHPIPENDKWWGPDFTDWANVRRGEPQFKDHYQPHIPSDLGYYDLRDEQVLERQAELAQEYGVYGFCFYYYWFGGKILLDLPIRRMLDRGKPDFPFCICWANENWTRRWDGRESEILIRQRHSPKDDLAFLDNVESVLLHKNYVRVEGKPLLIVYAPSFLPDVRATAARWREAFHARGHGEIFLAAMHTFGYRRPPQSYGFDAIIQFPPHTDCTPVTSQTKGLHKYFSGQVYDYDSTKWSFIDELNQLSSSRRVYPGVMPSWDNTARRRNKSAIWINASPESYYDWLRQVSEFLRKANPNDDKLVFINAWNEWAEGCHLEPDQLFGYAWLNATRLALQSDDGLR